MQLGSVKNKMRGGLVRLRFNLEYLVDAQGFDIFDVSAAAAPMRLKIEQANKPRWAVYKVCDIWRYSRTTTWGIEEFEVFEFLEDIHYEIFYITAP